MFASMNIYAKIAFVVMVAAMVLSYLFTRKRQRDLRLACNRFAFAFIKISNFVAPQGNVCKIRYKHKANGEISVQPIEQQCNQLKEILGDIKKEQVDSWYDEAQQALLDIIRLCGNNQALCRDYRDPVQRLFNILRTFLVGCENLQNIDTQQKADDFDSFLCEQLSHRKELHKRISWDGAEEFSKLNTSDNIQDIDKSTPEDKKVIDTPKKVEETALVEPAAEALTAPDAQNGDVVLLGQKDQEDDAPPESSLREKWRGWGCG
ncbi:hypothetical protein ACS3UN_01850 [Oscillospiraceae bacterium LTW-04]|nr:hypothetical protein RBH76_08610 [Oscillospiraceae bacterium MB24-C1]